MHLYHLRDSVSQVSRMGDSKSLKELQSRCQPGLLTYQGATWGGSVSKLMHVSLKDMRASPKDCLMSWHSASTRERSMSDPRGAGAPKTEAIVIV